VARPAGTATVLGMSLRRAVPSAGLVASGDSWLKAHLSGYASWAMTHHSLLAITWDENDASPGNQIPTIFVGQPVRSGRYPEPIPHCSVLRTLEERYRLPLTGHAATASLITGIWR
jgi:phosphatidylinositol-3-phosphatase